MKCIEQFGTLIITENVMVYCIVKMIILPLLVFPQLESYAVPLVEVVEDAVEKFHVSTNSVINFGCATGLTSFLLSATFEKVSISHLLCEQE